MAQCTCSQCQRVIRFKDELLGRQAKCPGCGAVVRLASAGDPVVASLPTAATAAQKVPRAVQPLPAIDSDSRRGPSAIKTPGAPKNADAVRGNERESIAAAIQRFDGQIPKVRTSLTYLLGSWIVCAFMILLPCVYLGLIGLVIFGVYYHLTHHIGMLGMVRGRGVLIAMALYATPLVAGVVLVGFMIKPLVARPAKRPRTRSLTRDGEPVLFALLERVCWAVGAPNPRRVDVTADVNASAGFRQGASSMLDGRDLVLTIGMPLAAGLSVSEFAGVLAHEFGHFSQGWGMRLNYVIRSINHWFLRVAYERDGWDEALDQAAAEVDIRIGLILHTARFCVWLTRRLLLLLTLVGHAVAGYFSRQMEFDADRYEIGLVGRQAFAATFHRMMELGLAQQRSQQDLEQCFREGTLPDNIPALVESHRSQFTQEFRKSVADAIAESRTGWCATHPADSERIARAARVESEGILHVDAPARFLFQHFDAICQGVTKDFYEAALGKRFSEQRLRPVSTLLNTQKEENGEENLLGEISGGLFDPFWGVEFATTHLETPHDPRQALADLQEARATLDRLKDSLSTRSAEYETVRQSRWAAYLYMVADRAALPTRKLFPDAQFANRKEARGTYDKLATRAETIQQDLQLARQALGKRMVNAIRLLKVPAVRQRMPNHAKQFAEGVQVVGALSRMNDVLPYLRELHEHFQGIALLCNHLRGSGDGLQSEITNLARKARENVESIRSALGRVPLPLATAQEVSIAKYLMPVTFNTSDFASLHQACSSLLEGFPGLYVRLAGRLAAITHELEVAVRSKTSGVPNPSKSPAKTSDPAPKT
ncbi:MAG: M48 family metallopeptidase [Planctomycetota bacterium]|nr:M48 family metallopeptidase [Planctomycetota bacterium]MDA1177843.1 M48 family metallopeptidase [Planctomycetota bacterium]